MGTASLRVFLGVLCAALLVPAAAQAAIEDQTVDQLLRGQAAFCASATAGTLPAALAPVTADVVRECDALRLATGDALASAQGVIAPLKADLAAHAAAVGTACAPARRGRPATPLACRDARTALRDAVRADVPAVRSARSTLRGQLAQAQVAFLAAVDSLRNGGAGPVTPV